MGQNYIEQQRRYVAISYVLMFLALFTIVFAVFAYLLARKVATANNAEVWIHAHALWIMRNVLLFILMAFFAALWFIPLFFFVWNSALWVTAMTVVGVVFSSIAWLFLLNAWLKGIARYFRNKAVF